MFCVGQEVVYPVHGAGVIEGIESREILGEIKEYYVLRIAAGDLRVLIPVDGVDNAGLREVSDKAALARVSSILADAPSPWDDNWNRRYRSNMDKLKSGSIDEIAQVVRDLTVRDMQKGLSSGEKKMLDNASKVLVSEMVLARRQSEESIMEELRGFFASREKNSL